MEQKYNFPILDTLAVSSVRKEALTLITHILRSWKTNTCHVSLLSVKKVWIQLGYRIHFPPFYVFSVKFGDIEELCLNSSFLLWKWIRCTFFDEIASYLFYLLFQLEISSLINPMVKVFGLRSGGMLLEKATISWIMEGAEKLYAGSQQQIVLYLKVSISFCPDFCHFSFCLHKRKQLEQEEPFAICIFKV